VRLAAVLKKYVYALKALECFHQFVEQHCIREKDATKNKSCFLKTHLKGNVLKALFVNQN